MSVLEQVASRIAGWRRDPVLFVRENFGAEPDEWQKDLLRAFADPDPTKKRIALQACAGPGKTAGKVWCAWNFLACYGGKDEHPNAYAMSVTGDNLRDNFWKETAVWYARSEFLQAAFEWQKEQIFARHHPATWWLRARTYSKSADIETQGRTLSGLHAPFIAYFIDESGDIAPPVLRSAEQGLTNCKWGKIVQGGNPTSHTGMLYQSVTEQAHRWHVIRVSGDPDDPMRSPRIDIEEARESIRTYGRENPWVMAYVLGKFPPTSLNTLLGPDDIAAAKDRYRALRKGSMSWSQKRLGVDVARFGDDKTVIFPRQGVAAFMPVQLRKRDTVQIAARVMLAIKKWSESDKNSEVVTFVDDSGHWGHGVLDNLKAGGFDVFPVLFEDTNTTDTRYYNRRAEMWMAMAEWIKGHGCLPPDLPGEMTAELTTPQYTFFKGKFMIEPKDQIKKRLSGRSPDLADALALTFSIPDRPAQMQNRLDQMRNQSGGGMVTDWDPFAEKSGGVLVA